MPDRQKQLIFLVDLKKNHAALYHLRLLSKIVFTQEPYIHCHYKYTTFPAQLIDVDIPVCIKAPVYSFKLHVSLIIFVIQYVYGDIITRRIHWQ